MANYTETMSRRSFLRFAGLSTVSLIAAACDVSREPGRREDQGISSEQIGVAPTPEVTNQALDSVEIGESYWDTLYHSPALNTHQDGPYLLYTSDMERVEVDLSGAEGFIPDFYLRVSDIEPHELAVTPPVEAGDFQAYLNTELDGFEPLAGHTDGTNDYNQYGDHASHPQLPAYSWMVHTGNRVEIPGIGRVEGSEGRAVMVLIINRTDRVYKFPENSVHVEAGYQGWGRIWSGEVQDVQEVEARLVDHYRARLGQGVPESGFVGQCDYGEQNCDEVTVVTVERMQWGTHEDGTARDQFRLIRAETVRAQ